MSNDLGIRDLSEVISYPDSFLFDFKADKKLEIADVIEHLRGLEIASRKLPTVLENLFAECDIKGVKARLVNIEVNEIRHGSLEEDVNFIFEWFFSKEDAEKIKEKLRSMSPGIKISLLLGALIAGYGIKSCSTPNAMTNTGNGVQQGFAINIGSTFNIPPEKVAPIIEKATAKPSAKEINGALQFMRPAKANGGKITFASGDTGASEISEDFIAATPAEYMIPAKTEHIELRGNVELQLRALDIDNPEKGWAAVIPDVLPDHRIKLELDPKIDRAQLSGLRIRGDVQVTYKIQKDGSKRVAKALLLAVKKNNE